MKSYQFFTEDGRGGTMLCDDESLEKAVSELTQRFPGVVKVQIGTEVWHAENGTITDIKSGEEGPEPAPSG